MIATADSLGVPEWFNVASHFVDRHISEGRSGRTAIECGDERVSYGDLYENVNRCGTALQRRFSVRPEERVLLLLHDGPGFAYAFFGALKIGAVPVPLNTLWKSADYEYVVRDSRASVLIVSAALLPQVEKMTAPARTQLQHVIVVGGDDRAHRFEDILEEAEPALEPELVHRDAPAFWLYSSGSTGVPKGCVHLQHDMVVCAELFAKQVLGITERDRTFSVAKLFFAYGLGNGLYFPLAVGATTILWPGPPTAANVYAVVERYRPTLFYSVPTGYGMLLAHTREGADFDLSSVRLAVSAGEALPPALYERFKTRYSIDIIDGIGSTEALQMFISNRPGAIRPGSSGQIVPGYAARILDDAGVAVPEGEVGNLWICGDSVCAGYWNQHEKTKDTIQGHWLRTGDKYTQDADGFFWYAGRSDDMLKVGGLWVSPVEVENALVAHPAVLECGVVGREDHDGLIKPMAFVVLKPDIPRSPQLATELQHYVRDRLAEYKRPRWVEFLPDLPKTATGKIQRFRLRQLVDSA
jgi:benzoate-CoA ligase